MGNVYSNFDQENVNQTQISQANQKCGQSGSASIQGVQITIIDSHIGDVELSNTLSITKMDCILDAVTQLTSAAAIANASTSEQSSLIFQMSINSANNTDITNITSFQQSLINQVCTETATANIDNVTVTIIDSTTGNIRIANTSQVDTFSCNLSATSYQSATAQVSDSSSSKQSTTCCGFDLSMLIPLIFGIIAVGVISKLATPKKQPTMQDNTQLIDILGAAAIGNSLGLGNSNTTSSQQPRQAVMI